MGKQWIRVCEERAEKAKNCCCQSGRKHPLWQQQLGNEYFEPISQFDQFELTRVLGAIEGVTHDDLAQFGQRINITEHAIQEIQETLQVVMGVNVKRIVAHPRKK